MSASNSGTAPDPQKLGRSSHLCIFVMNTNTVRCPPQRADGTATRWLRSNGEQCEALFKDGEPELEPLVLNGERVEWINPTNRACTVIFSKEEVPEFPFEDGEREFTLAPGHSVLSSVVKGKIGTRYRYRVDFPEAPRAGDGGHRGNPVIIIRG